MEGRFPVDKTTKDVLLSIAQDWNPWNLTPVYAFVVSCVGIDDGRVLPRFEIFHTVYSYSESYISIFLLF
jgi:hypothetical protein